MYPPGASIMLKPTKTPLRNLQRPPRLQRWHLEDALDFPQVGPLFRRKDIWILISSFLDVYLGHPVCQTPPRDLSGNNIVLLDSMMTLRRHIGEGALPRKVEIWKLMCNFPDVSLRHKLVVIYGNCLWNLNVNTAIHTSLICAVGLLLSWERSSGQFDDVNKDSGAIIK